MANQWVLADAAPPPVVPPSGSTAQQILALPVDHLPSQPREHHAFRTATHPVLPGWEVLAATDLLTVEMMTLLGLVRYHIPFVLGLCTRRVEIAGFLRDKRYPIHDRSPVLTRQFKEILKAAGVKAIDLPRRSPDVNPHAE